MRHHFVHVKGIVQGVGFRPFVFNLAQQFNLKGSVCNTADGVYIHVEGSEASVDSFIDQLSQNPPPLALVQSVSIEELPLIGYSNFEILHSDKESPKQTLVSPDAAICAECKQEIMNPLDRRFLYPFTNCTNCGPRYTIIRDIPYDRANTTMESFIMCPDCDSEYHDPTNRRFHAQPNACSVCGPQMSLYSIQGKKISGFWHDEFKDKILANAIFGIKSLGGFHLACRGDIPQPIRTLRERKNRPFKPFAVMCKDIDTIRTFAKVSSAEEKLLKSPQAPIVLLDIIKKSEALEEIAPGLSSVGVMLPYTPLHCLLFDETLRMLIMTSGNRKSLPLTYMNDLSFTELENLADYLLIHDREIQNRCDDSVIRVFRDTPYFYRRSRGFTPLPITVPFTAHEPVLALGSDMKNTYCLLKGNQAFLGPHIGDLHNQEALEYFIRSYQDMKVFLGIQPDITAHDLHPTMMSTKVADESEANSQTVSVQHHHAHMASCMADNNLSGKEPVLGVILDGTGYGTDKNIWGFEILHGDYSHFNRLYHLANVPLPGSEAAILHPWRMACSYLWQYTDKDMIFIKQLFTRFSDQIETLHGLWTSRINSPLTSSCGRFFDSISALLQICTDITYDGQAAIELMEHADQKLPYQPYPFDLENSQISPRRTILTILDDLEHGVPVPIIAARFHHTIVEMIYICLTESRIRTQCSQVVLSGGVFQNEYLLSLLIDRLSAEDFSVYYHRQVPTNDGGIALGQAVVALQQS